jgi:hypothetical protein
MPIKYTYEKASLRTIAAGDAPVVVAAPAPSELEQKCLCCGGFPDRGPVWRRSWTLRLVTPVFIVILACLADSVFLAASLVRTKILVVVFISGGEVTVAVRVARNPTNKMHLRRANERNRPAGRPETLRPVGSAPSRILVFRRHGRYVIRADRELGRQTKP